MYVPTAMPYVGGPAGAALAPSPLAPAPEAAAPPATAAPPTTALPPPSVPAPEVPASPAPAPPATGPGAGSVDAGPVAPLVPCALPVGGAPEPPVGVARRVGECRATIVLPGWFILSNGG